MRMESRKPGARRATREIGPLRGGRRRRMGTEDQPRGGARAEAARAAGEGARAGAKADISGRAAGGRGASVEGPMPARLGSPWTCVCAVARETLRAGTPLEEDATR